MPFLQKNIFFVHNHPKTLFFWAFVNFRFPCFFFNIFSFSFSNIKKTKTKSAHFFPKPSFDTLTNCQKIIFAPLYTICVFFKITKTHYKIGVKQAKTNLGPSFDATLDQGLTQKTQILDQVLTLQHIIYTCIYACCEVINWSKFGLSNGY